MPNGYSIEAERITLNGTSLERHAGRGADVPARERHAGRGADVPNQGYPPERRYRAVRSATERVFSSMKSDFAMKPLMANVENHVFLNAFQGVNRSTF